MVLHHFLFPNCQYLLQRYPDYFVFNIMLLVGSMSLGLE
jgi:hypothetical protein